MEIKSMIVNIITTSGNLMLKVFDNVSFKAVVTFFFVLLHFLFDQLHTRAIIALLVLIIGDFIFGIWGSYKSGEEIKSYRVRDTVVKIIVYFSMISFSYMVETAGLFFIPVDETVITFLAVTELISIFENISRMGYIVPKRLLNKLRDGVGAKDYK